MRRIIGGLAGLGLMAGAGSVIYNHHGATVQITDKNGHVHNVQLQFGKQHYQCPSGESGKLEPLLIRQGRIRLTLGSLEKDIKQVERQYPGAHPNVPPAVVNRVETEFARLKPLVKAYHAAVHQYNAALDRDCSPTSG